MYNADQLNELLVTELHDIAEPLEISQYRRLDKASLIQKILESQAIMNTKSKPESGDKPKRKRILKTDLAKPSDSVSEPASGLRADPPAPEKRKYVKKKEGPRRNSADDLLNRYQAATGKPFEESNVKVKTLKEIVEGLEKYEQRKPAYYKVEDIEED